MKPSFNLLIGSSYRESQANLSPKEATAPGDAAYAEGLYRKLGYVEAVLLRDLLTTAQCLLPTTTDMIILSPDDHPLTAHSISDFRNSTIAETLMVSSLRLDISSIQIRNLDLPLMLSLPVLFRQMHGVARKVLNSLSQNGTCTR